MVRYPISVYPKGNARAQQVVVGGPEDFVRMYSSIVYPQLEDAVSTAREATLSGHAEGVMIGRGHIWFGKACENSQCTRYSVKILTINPAIPEDMYRSIKEKMRASKGDAG